MRKSYGCQIDRCGLVSKPNKRGRNVSLIGAISVNEVLTSVNLIGTTDAITFEAFIIRKLVPKLWKGACAVMDNCTILGLTH